MGTTPLRQFLQSLCNNSSWNYTVFWKLWQQNQMLLTWEDGCYDHLKLKGPMESLLDDTHFSGMNEVICQESNEHRGHSVEYSILQAVAEMEGIQYAWGEGVVGEVAYAGNHLWVSYEDISDLKLESQAVPKYPDEWLLQFAAGIKTILLVPVVPHGVLQLGSLNKVAEDPKLVACVRDKFSVYKNCLDLSSFTCRDFLPHASFSAVPVIVDNLDELSTAVMNQMKSEDPITDYRVKPTNVILSAANDVTPVSGLPDACYISRKDVLDVPEVKRKGETCLQSVDSIKASKSLNQPLKDAKLETREGKMIGCSSLEEELPIFSYSGNQNWSMYGEHGNAAVNSYFVGGMAGKPSRNKDTDVRSHKNVSASFNFPIDCELHKALGPTFLEQTKEHIWNSSLLYDDAFSCSGQMLSKNNVLGIDSSAQESNGWFSKTDETAYLLEAVVASMYNHLNDDSSQRASDVNSSVTSGQFSASNNAKSQSNESAVVENKGPQSITTTTFCARGRNPNIKSPPSSSFESVVSTLIEEQQQKKGYRCLQSRNGLKLYNACKRRTRTGENPKPRPRDRQLIQDRVKDLRELVPNGSKCSIDGLLERTIKHMEFLRSVTDHAEKLRQCVSEEVTGRRNTKSFHATCNNQSGTTWAFELGSDVQVCPIIVEDLEKPGHMLIKMLCDDHGLFLEIAEIIRHVELTILKGVMESYSDNTWACFIVEASKGFHRLDIFWPLMQLLQQNQRPISCKS
ncbi:hypothetical protein NMG60_11005362 [Bertholletia excelsa]